MDQPIADTLAAFARTAKDPVPLAELSLRPMLVREVQAALTRHGLLDPEEDLLLGPVTSWALQQAAALADEKFENTLSPALARRLAAPEPLLPLAPDDDFAGRIARAMLARGDWICRHKDVFTIAYVEGTEVEGRPSPDRADAFDDVRVLLRVAEGGRPVLAGAWAATTRAGRKVERESEGEKGPPRLEPGQYKAWVIGITAIGTELEQDALIQMHELPVSRDETHRELGMFVIDQHGGGDAPRARVGETSAGCLVAHEQQGHRAFMALLRCDPRYRVNNAYRFMTSVLSRAQFDATQPGSKHMPG